ncbi:MAG: hypothetical protein MI919_18125 [Holophagales bacterium]|nr:hypothetical protein [Holophagales bacterium]
MSRADRDRADRDHHSMGRDSVIGNDEAPDRAEGRKRPADRKRLISEVERKRRAVEARLGDLKTSVHRETRFLPKGEGWVLPMVAFAVGLALSGWGKRRRSPSRETDRGPE